MNFATLTKDQIKGSKGGYKDKLYYIPIEDVTTFAKTVEAVKLATTPTPLVPVLGDKFLITQAHTITAPKGWYSVDAKRYSAKITSQLVGDTGAEEDLFTAVIEVIGDDHVISELIYNIRNTESMILFKDSDCQTNDVYNQLGDSCNSVRLVSALDSGGSDEQGSQKKWTLTFTCKSRFFYKAAVQMHA